MCESEERWPDRSFAGIRSVGLEAKRKVVETWRAGATSVERLSWSSAWMAWVEKA